MDALIECVSPNAHPLSHYIADIIGFLCHSGNNSRRIVQSDILRVIVNYGSSTDYELQYWAIALMFNLAEASDAFAHTVIEKGAFEFVEQHILKGERAVIRVTAAKVAVVLAQKGLRSKPSEYLNPSPPPQKKKKN